VGLAFIAILGMAILGIENARASDALTLKGATSDGGAVELVVDSQWRVTAAQIEWKAPCRHHAGKLITGTSFELRQPSPSGSFSAGGRYRFRDHGYRIAVRTSMSGSEQRQPVQVIGAEKWFGKFHARAVVKRRGRVVARCATKHLGWGVLANVPEAKGTGSGTLTMTSDPGDFVGAGKSYSFSAPPLPMQGSGYGQVVGFRIDDWSLSFSPGQGDTLHPGTYSGAIRHPFNVGTSSPGLDVDGEGRGCGDLTGSFTVNSITYDHWNRLQATDISFEQRCEGSAGALWGRVRFTRDP
jgi:hypothetical protein